MRESKNDENFSTEKQPKNTHEINYKLIIVVMACILFCVFIILPALFILLESVFPDCISGNGALNQLSTNINSLVGYLSLIVGIVSIIYAYQSNNLLDKHQEKHEEFLKEISEKVRDIDAGNTKIYDQILNKHESHIIKQDDSK